MDGEQPKRKGTLEQLLPEERGIKSIPTINNSLGLDSIPERKSGEFMVRHLHKIYSHFS